MIITRRDFLLKIIIVLCSMFNKSNSMQESHFEKLTVGQQIASLSCKPEVCHVFDKIWPPLVRILSQLNSIRTPHFAFKNFVNP